jgi:hypothetical protein
VCEINDPGHTCDEYLVLFKKSSMIDSYGARGAWGRGNLSTASGTGVGETIAKHDMLL